MGQQESCFLKVYFYAEYINSGRQGTYTSFKVKLPKPGYLVVLCRTISSKKITQSKAIQLESIFNMEEASFSNNKKKYGIVASGSSANQYGNKLNPI